MKTKYANKKTFLWIFIVYILSLLCYLPVLAEQCGIILPNGLLYLRYLFVCIPAVITISLSICEKNLNTYFEKMFSGKITIRTILTWILFATLGALVSFCCLLGNEVNVFQNTYPSIAVLLQSCVYLLITGFVEEIAWRGFLLERVSLKRKGFCKVVFVGIVWAVWHLPMWTIRNSLGIEQIVYYFIWTILVSVVLGITYYQCKNVLFVAMLHMVFNVCYLAPVQYNIAILSAIILIGTWLEKKNLARLWV